MSKQKKVALVILDGWGYGKKDESDAIFMAKTPIFDKLIKTYPNATLKTHGKNVGLPDGQMGNSEVGHLNIGAGRVVYQDLVKINNAIKDNSVAGNKELLAAFEYAKENDRKVHFIGLVSDGGIHSHLNHLVKLCKLAAENNVKNSFIHAFTDGRDTDPKSGRGYLQFLQKEIKDTPTKIASVIGRYYSMDRDLRWERIKKAYDLMVHGIGESSEDVLSSINKSYNEGVTDEFLEPLVITNENDKAVATIEPNDVVICFNYRTDRCREITRALHQESLKEHSMQKLPLYYVTMTNYDDNFKGVHVIFKKNNLENTLGEVISKNNLSQIRIAETEKYPHVTFFFSGGREINFENERRIMVNSPKVATYDLMPEMSAEEVKAKIVSEIQKESADFICLNFANPDMVGHTGVFQAIKKAVEKVDTCLGEIIECGVDHDYSFIIIADHGNADFAINNDGTPNTAHTTNLVPVILIDSQYSFIKDGKLADVAPTILKMMNLKVPSEMTGDILI